MATDNDPIYGIPVIKQPAFEGASVSYKQGLRGIIQGDINTLAARELVYLQMRSNHAIRSNGYAFAAHTKNAINLKAVKVNWLNDKGVQHENMQKYWDEFAEEAAIDGYGNLNTLQDTVNKGMYADGNAFIRMLIRPNTNSQVPLKLQVIPARMHDIFYRGDNPQDTDINYGIRFKDSKPVSYFFNESLYDVYGLLKYDARYETKEIPADEICHLFIRNFPGQWLGTPELAPILLPLYELDELTDATIAKQKASQAISWIVENSNPANALAVGANKTVTDKEDQKKIIFQSTGGAVQYLNKGEKIRLQQSEDIGNNLGDLLKFELYRISAALGIPYHSLTGDASDLDFSSIRAIAIELRYRVEYIHHYFTIPLGLQKIATRFKELALVRKLKVSGAFPSYQLPRIYGADELKDGQSDLLEIQSGMGTLKRALDERHLSYQDIEKDREEIKRIGLSHLLEGANTSTAQITNNKANSNSTGN